MRLRVGNELLGNRLALKRQKPHVRLQRRDFRVAKILLLSDRVFRQRKHVLYSTRATHDLLITWSLRVDNRFRKKIGTLMIALFQKSLYFRTSAEEGPRPLSKPITKLIMPLISAPIPEVAKKEETF